MERFRPNIIVGAAQGDLKPFEEDLWKTLEIGGEGETFFSAGRCPRCMVNWTSFISVYLRVNLTL
jgi:uncharacterized protein YcbX